MLAVAAKVEEPVLVSDVRFEPEAGAFHAVSGITIGIERPASDPDTDAHTQEAGVTPGKITHTVVNDGGLGMSSTPTSRPPRSWPSGRQMLTPWSTPYHAGRAVRRCWVRNVAGGRHSAGAPRVP